MTNQRFTIETFCDVDNEYKCIFDNENEKEIISDDGFWFEERYSDVVGLLNEQQATIQSLKEENRKLRNIHLSIDLTYSYGFGRYLADVRVIDDE